MSKIYKKSETMTSKERVRKTFNYEKTDRVTIGYAANLAIHKKLTKALGVPYMGYEDIYQALGVDYRSINAPYIGPELFKAIDNRQINQLEGSIMKWVEHKTGGYWDFCDFPLQGACEELFYSFTVPNPDCFDYDLALKKVKSYDNKYALFIGSAAVPDVINSNGRIMGMEDILCFLVTEDKYAIDFINRRANFQLEVLERLLDKCKDNIDFMWLGEDLGTQIAPMISIATYRKMLKPIHKRFVDLAKAYNIPTMFHSCGSSSWAYNDYIEIGVSGVDSIQPEATNMSLEYLAKNFSDKLNFRGAISTAGSLANGTPKDVEKICKETIDILNVNNGYHFAASHAIQDNSPVENVIAMYQAAHDYNL